MTDFTIYTVTLPGYPHTRCFEELSLGLASGFRELGYDVKETKSSRQIEGRAIVLGAHLLKPKNRIYLPMDAIIYNTEQMKSDWINYQYMAIMSHRVVWDYSQDNVAKLREMGVDAHFCGVGYAPELERIPKVTEDLDVVFYGSMNERRAVILEKLIDAGINLYIIPFGTYGAERDAILARAKIVLNIHYYENAPFEIVRCSYLMANQKYFISEDSIDGKNHPYNICFHPYDKLVDVCIETLKHEENRIPWTKTRYRQFKRTRQSDYIKAALESMAAAVNQPSPAPQQSLPRQLVYEG